jgi:hypothetical protein
MSNYLLVYTGGNGMPESEAEQAAVMGAWGAWMGSLGDALVDGGNPVSGSKQIASDGTVSDGAVGSHPATGYSIIKADSHDAAVALAKQCPIIGVHKGQITVYETFEM